MTTNQELTRRIGERLQRYRLGQDLTQKDLAEKAGVSRRTVINAENGERTTLSTLISIMRVLGLLDNIDQLIPEPIVSPLDVVKQTRKTKKRASGKRGSTAKPDSDSSGWEWGE